MKEDDPDFGKVWLDVKHHMPTVPRKYWLTDGKDVALAEWSIENMHWKFLYMYSCFKPTHMLPVKLPPRPTVEQSRAA